MKTIIAVFWIHFVIISVFETRKQIYKCISFVLTELYKIFIDPFDLGDLVSVIIDFAVIALVVYFGVKALGLDKLDKKKEKI